MLNTSRPRLVKQTLTLYTHLLKPTKQEDACRLEQAVFGKDGSKMGAKTKKGATA
jgi:hypothetical protein